MTDTPQHISPDTARKQMQSVQAKLDQRKAPTKSDTRMLLDTVASLAAQLEETQKVVGEAQSQLSQLTTLVKEWNELFAAFQGLGLHVWEELKGGVAYQWQGGPVVRGFPTWSAAIEAALKARQL